MNTDARPSALIADDEPFIRAALTRQLKGDFRVVGEAETTTEAIELADQHRPAVALLDVEMPGGGARTAVPAIAARSPDTCIVILSGNEPRQLVLELLEAGATAYVRKGVTAAEIVAALTNAMKMKAGRN